MSLKRFYHDRYLHIRSFALSFIAAAGLCAVAYSLRLHDYAAFEMRWWTPLLILPAIYIGGLSAVWIHNATHDSFRPRALNWPAGQLAGIHQLWGFNGWKLIHLLHHHYSDRDGMDPHPPKGLTFRQFLLKMFWGSSKSVSARYREHWGQSGKTALMHKAVMLLSIGMGLLHLLFWYLLLGPAGFVFFYLPSLAFNHWLFTDINYTAHPADPETGETKAANLNHTPYYKLANFLWHGIYFHGNHHRKPLLFNPRKMVERERPPRSILPESASAPVQAKRHVA